MTITLTQLYQALSDKFGKQEAENLTSYVEQKVKAEIEDRKFITEDILEKHLSKLETKLVKWMVGLWVILLLALFFKPH